MFALEIRLKAYIVALAVVDAARMSTAVRAAGDRRRGGGDLGDDSRAVRRGP
jgi:hypothetical protein